MSIRYHYYSTVLIARPLEKLWSDLRDALLAPHSILSHRDPIAVALADPSAPTMQIAIRSGDTDTLEAVLNLSEPTHTLTYRTNGSAREIAEYAATCTLQRLADEPSTTIVEWTRIYRPAIDADPERSSAVLAQLRDQAQTLAARLATAYDAAEVVLDYTLGGAAIEGRANQAANRFAGYAKAA